MFVIIENLVSLWTTREYSLWVETVPPPTGTLTTWLTTAVSLLVLNWWEVDLNFWTKQNFTGGIFIVETMYNYLEMFSDALRWWLLDHFQRKCK